MRRELNLPRNAALALFCTAEWQHADYGDADGERLRDLVPELLARHIGRADPRLHLLHLGPRPLHPLAALGARYHWMSPQPGPIFRTAMAASDLLLTLNISGTTVTSAIAAGVPVLWLRNGLRALTGTAAAAQLPGPGSPWLVDWLARAAPVYPFAMWPLGFSGFLAPVLAGNGYLDVVKSAEILDEVAVQAALTVAIFDTVERRRLQRAQAEYMASLLTLPEPADVLLSQHETQMGPKFAKGEES